MTLVHWRRTVESPVSCGAEPTLTASLSVAQDYHGVTCPICQIVAVCFSGPHDPNADTREHIEEASA